MDLGLEERAHERAIDLARRELISQDSLKRVQDMSADITKQKVALRSQLSMLANGQVEEARLATSLIDKSYHTIKELSSDFATMNELCEDSHRLIEGWYTFRTVAITMRNVRNARKMLKGLLDLQQHVEDIDDMLRDPSLLLEAHERALELERIKDDALLVITSEAEMDEFQPIFEQYFKMIDDMSLRIENAVFHYIENVLQYSQEDPAAVVRALRVIQRQEMRDEELSRTNKCVEQKRFRDKCIYYLRKQIFTRFEDALNEAESVKQKLDVFHDITSDLYTVSVDVVPLFPKHYKIMDFFSEGYQETTRDYIEQIANKHAQLSNVEKLALIDWVRKYPELLEENGSHSLVDISPAVGNLAARFVADSTSMLIEWCGRIVTQHSKTTEPEFDSNGKPFTLSPLDIFKMLNQQLQIMKTIKRDDMILSIADACRATLNYYQMSTFSSLKDRIPNVSLELLCAHANDNIKSIQYTEEIEELFETLIEDNDEILNERISFEQAIEGFVSGNRTCATLIADEITRTVSAEFRKLFTKSWQAESPIDAIVDTYVDYYNDLNVYLDEKTLGYVSKVLLEKTISLYLNTMLGSNAVKITDYSADLLPRISGDYQRILNFFRDYIAKEEYLLAATSPLHSLVTLTEPRESIDFQMALGDVLHEFPDFPFSVVETIINARTDFPKKRNEIIESAKHTYETQMSANAKEGVSTRLKQPSVFRQFAKDKDKRGAHGTLFTSAVAAADGNPSTSNPQQQQQQQQQPQQEQPTPTPIDDYEEGEVIPLSELLGDDIITGEVAEEKKKTGKISLFAKIGSKDR